MLGEEMELEALKLDIRAARQNESFDKPVNQVFGERMDRPVQNKDNMHNKILQVQHNLNKEFCSQLCTSLKIEYISLMGQIHT